jgi:hypothetical protein
MTIYIILAGPSSTDPNAVANRDNLGKAIGELAKNANTPVFFHDYTSTGSGSAHLAGAPVILLECSEAFLQDVKKLPGFTLAMEKTSPLPTARSADLWSYFTGEPAMPARGATPKRPPKQFRL